MTETFASIEDAQATWTRWREQLPSRDLVNEAVYLNQHSHVWRGYGMDKCAQDLLIYQAIIFALRPEIVIECGTWAGGSALFFADICELVGCGEVLTIDRAPGGNYDWARGRYINGTNGEPLVPLPGHQRLTYLTGDSTDAATLAQVRDWAAGRTGFVILDSDHTKVHVLAELDAYQEFVPLGGYLVVEDTNVNGHPVRPDFGDGPWEAVHEWLGRHPSFAIDHDMEPYLTSVPCGYLRRVQ